MPERADSKASARAAARAAVRALGAEARADGSRAIVERLLEMPWYAGARTILLYMPLPSEVDVLPLIERCLAEGRTVCLPRVDLERREMSALAVDSIDEATLPADVREKVEGGQVRPAG